jgi:hypothetical protein
MSKKYLNIPTKVDGVKFDSRKEAHRYLVLKDRQNKGLISGLELQPSFELCPAFIIDGVRHRKISYIADFSYSDKETGHTVVEDVKGVKVIQTQVYKIKKKLFLKRYVAGQEDSIRFKEIL